MSKIDGTDRMAIFKMNKDGLPSAQIATKLEKDKASVDDVLKQFLNKGKDSVKNKDFRQAAFWYFQHKKYILGDDVDFPKLNISLKKSRHSYPELLAFLKGETENDTINVNTDFGIIPDLWSKKWETYEGETGDDYEAVLDNEGGGFVDDETEELFLESVCKIIHKDLSFSGIYVDAGAAGRGILTSSDIFNSPEDCYDAKAQFSKVFDDNPTTINFKPDHLFKRKGGVSFIGCDTSVLDQQEFNPLEEKNSGKTPKKDATINTFFYSGKNKLSSTSKLTNKKTGQFDYDGKFLECSIGAPIFCESSFIGMTSGERKDVDGAVNEAIDILTVFSWLCGDGVGDGVEFEDEEEVLATWTDSYEYKARIICKTENGYKVNYYEFGEEAEQPATTIKKKKKKKNKKNIPRC